MDQETLEIVNFIEKVKIFELLSEKSEDKEGLNP